MSSVKITWRTQTKCTKEEFWKAIDFARGKGQSLLLPPIEFVGEAKIISDWEINYQWFLVLQDVGMEPTRMEVEGTSYLQQGWNFLSSIDEISKSMGTRIVQKNDD